MSLSRRAFVASLAASARAGAAERGDSFPSEAVRYADPATEFPVVRLTDPAHASWLPAGYNRFISRRGNFFIYASDRTGSPQAYRMDLKTGQSRALLNVAALAPESLCLLPDEKSFCCLAGRALYQAGFGAPRARQVYTLPDGWAADGGLGLTDDGQYAVVAERETKGAEARRRLRLIAMRTGEAATAVEAAEPLSDPMPRPRRAGILYRRSGGEIWLVNFDGAQNRRLHLAPGAAGPSLWSPDGRTVLYLNFPQDRKVLNNLREFTPDANEDRMLAGTSQFVQFGRNADASVIVGASGSHASPYVLLLLRSVKRELTLCEHRASVPARVNPVFAPDSQRIFFQSDRHGKMAIYSMRVEKLVAETEVE